MKIVDYLKGLSNRVVIGQHVGAGSFYPTGWSTYVTALETAGKRPLWLGADLAYGEWPTTWTDKLIDHADRGGIVSFSWHAPNPWTGGPVTDTTVGTKAQLWTPGNAAYNALHSGLDGLAAIFKRFGTREIIFRPWHEMNGAWHWYEGWSGAEFYNLWSETRSYLTNVHGLNLIWLWSPNRGYEEITDPMQYVACNADIRGLDHYANDLEWLPDGGYTSLVAGNYAPLGLGEFGPGTGGEEPAKNSFDYSTLIDMILRDCPRLKFFMAWNGNYALVNQRGISALMADPRTVWLGDSGDIAGSPPTTVITPAKPTSGRSKTTIRRRRW